MGFGTGMTGDLMIGGVSLTFLIMGIVQVLRMQFKWFRNKHSSLVTILIGIAGAFIYHFAMHQLNVFETMCYGLEIGFQAAGLYMFGGYYGGNYMQEPEDPYNPSPYEPTPSPEPTPTPTPTPTPAPVTNNNDNMPLK